MSDEQQMEMTALEKLLAKKEKLDRQIALVKRKDSEKKRKERAHRLIREGGLVEMILGESVDAGLLTGLLESRKELFANPDCPEGCQLKALGDKIIVEHENRKKEDKTVNDGS